MKNSNTSFTYSTEFNISTTGNRKENRYWENYIDFSLEKGIQFCSRDYAEGQLGNGYSRHGEHRERRRRSFFAG